MKIPKYVQELVKQRRIRPAPLDEQGELYDQKLGEYGTTTIGTIRLRLR